MKKKLYLLFFTVEGFDQISDEDDDDGVDPDEEDLDKSKGGEEDFEGNLDTTDKDSQEDDANPIDDLDKASFIKKDILASACGNKQRSVVSATEFHPKMLLENAHTAFIEEIKRCGLPESDNCDKVDEEMISPMRMFSSPPKDGEPMSVHMDYISQQLKNFDMVESDEEEGDNL
uniref:Uncharacterized protein n=1 Tax=Hordeum vulgare subsp. vulgare TaxID=112509 RepID=A0A8I7BFM0_HORVV